MGSADYFFKVDDAKTAIILEAKQVLDKKHPKDLKAGGAEALFTDEELDIDILKTNSMRISHKRLKKYLTKKIVDFDKYGTYTESFIGILNNYLKYLRSRKINTKEESIKKYIIDEITEILDYDIASMEHGLDNDTYTSPEEQVKAYLDAKEYGEYKVYGILSNGLIWKLFYKDKNKSSSNDPIAIFDLSLLLEDTITQSEKNKLCAYFVETFKYPNLLANEKNFKCSLMDNLLEIDDCLYSESLNLSEKLFKNIINKGYIELAKGIAYASRANNVNLTPEQLEQYSMKILFRFIFILYAEARGFLPLNQTTYYERYSLEKIARELGKNKDTGSSIEDDLWARVNDLFRTIDNGKMGGHIRVPVYNGGLFREYKDDLLNKIYIENNHLVEVLFSLIYHEKKVTYDRIDYNLLDVKYIGTVYERLLDYKIIEDGNGYKLKSKGDNNARKDLGAYYTPDNVTKYMIKNTVDKKLNIFKDNFLKHNNTEEAQQHCILKSILKLKIIDISCGSGHFLIDTIDYLADKCLEVRTMYEDEYSNFHSKTLLSIHNTLNEINNNDEFKTSDFSKATFRDVVKRYILKNSIYGVDINPLATDITKFAIWLETFIVGVPLSFMDNHIKCGNSVLGFIDNIYSDIDLNSLSSEKENLFLSQIKAILHVKKNEFLSIIENIKELSENIDSNTDINTEEVEENYASFSKIDSRVYYLKFNLIPLTILHYTLKDASIMRTLNSKSNRVVLDKLLEVYLDALSYTDYTSFMETYFIYHKKPEILYKKITKHKIPKDFFNELLKLLHIKRENTANKISKIIDNVFTHEFTNWFIEFPNTKFDIIIGNPPYVKADSDGDFAKQRDIILNGFDYETLYEKWDLMMAFVERAYKLLADDGIMSLIIKDDYLMAKYALKSKVYFVENSKINRIDFLSDIHIFAGVGVKNVILEYQKSNFSDHEPLRVKHFDNFGITKNMPTKIQNTIGVEVFDIHEKIDTYDDTVPLGDIAYISIGMVLNANEKEAKGLFKKSDLITEFEDETHCKKYIEGKDISSFSIDGYRYLEWGTERCPALIRRPTFPELHETEKFLINKIGDMVSVFDRAHLYCEQTLRIGILWYKLQNVDNRSLTRSIETDYKIKGETNIQVKRVELENISLDFDERYIVGLLNSSLFKEFMIKISKGSKDINPSYLKALPIKRVSENKQRDIINLVEEITYNESQLLHINTEHLRNSLDKMVSELYAN